ncbi:MAG: VanW family protein [Clostridia bacterium]|nr:VanW family protein [Clostridia bacterium]
MEELRKEKSSRLVLFVVISSAVVLALILLFGLFMDNGIIKTNDFGKNTTLNGINVSSLSAEEASTVLASRMLENKNEIEINLTYRDKSWSFKGEDFETNNNIFPIVQQTLEKSRQGSIIDRIEKVKSFKNLGENYQISYRYILGNFDSKIDDLSNEIYKAPKDSFVDFKPESKIMFTYVEGEDGLMVNKEKLYQNIDEAFKNGVKISVEVPVKNVQYESNKEDLMANTSLRSKFSTGYSGSQYGRKNNVKRCLKDFNGMVIKPGETISFNDITGEKTAEKGYMKANIILNGIYVAEYGGGACQASSTLYNAALLAGLDVLEANHHSIPVSYVPLSLDAMVSEGYSDMKFQNNTSHNIYIKAYGDENNAYVEMYGEPLEEGVTMKTRTECLETLPHNGDVIMKDTSGKYASKVTYKGEFFRLKKPSEGYRTKSYLQKFKDGELVEEKLIREDTYQPQQGIIVEGSEELGEGMTLPENTVKVIAPQFKVLTNNENVSKKIEAENPGYYNP